MTSFEPLFTPFRLRTVEVPNRIAMAPMTRSFSPEQTPGENVAAYYKARAANGVGLIITEGVTLSDMASSPDPNVPKLAGDLPLDGWRRVVEAVHSVGGKIFPQIWHVGAVRRPDRAGFPDVESKSPSGLFKPGKPQGRAMDDADIAATLDAYAEAARNALALGFDGVEIHGAHGYLIDQFFWNGTNERSDLYGGDMVGRTAFARAVIRTVREATTPDYPIILRFSQWKQQDYEAKLAQSPQELEAFLGALSDAGADAFHCSTRRFWQPEFEGSDLNLAGWAKKLTGKPSITVGSIALDTDFITTYGDTPPARTDEAKLDELMARFNAGEFDMVAIGRALIANPDLPQILREGRLGDIRPYDRALLFELA